MVVVDVTPVGCPERAEHAILGMDLAGRFIGQIRPYLWSGGHFVIRRNPFLSPNNFTQGHVSKIEWLVTNVTAIESPERAEHAFWGVILTERFVAQFRLYL